MSRMTQEQTETRKPQRMYKDRIFRMVFSEKRELLSLYNAMNGTAYKNPDELQINTLENAIYMGMRNDLSFLIDSQLPLYEHQSTYNPNIPLRDFLYSSSLYSKLTLDTNLYGNKLVKIPTPHFVVFYNGWEKQPERKELLLLDAFEVQEEEKSLELRVLMLNINEGFNETLKTECKTLQDYMCYVDKVRTYAQEVPLEQAVERAIEECIRDDVLADFLRNNRAEAKSMSIFEYDEELHMRQEREASRQDGLEEGRAQGLAQGLGQGLEQGRQQAIARMLKKLTPEEIMELGFDADEVRKVLQS